MCGSISIKTFIILTIVSNSCGSDSYISFSIGRSHFADSPGTTQIVYPRIRETVVRRRRRDTHHSSVYLEESSKLTVIEVGDWSLELNSESNLVVGPDLAVEWVSFSNPEDEAADDRNWGVTLRALQKCDYRSGVVRGLETASKVAVTVCGRDITGYVHVGGGEEMMIIRPLTNASEDGAHQLYSIGNKRMRRSVDTPRDVDDAVIYSQEQWLSNLTGDMIDVGGGGGGSIDMGDEDEQEEQEIESDIDVTSSSRPPLEDTDSRRPPELDFVITVEEERRHQPPKGWRREQLDDEELGYFFDTAWTADDFSPFNTTRKKLGSALPPRWLEIAIGVDYTLINFHGKDKVEQYVLALMNIVSAIYQDVSLEANMKLVVTRLLLYEHKKQSVVRPGNAKKSLENVNSWNKRLHASLPPDGHHHDVAVWLTRSDIGGPSGYAPVGGTCDPKRSCALNRDEGLTSAFIIAHEMAHILGLTHDGDKKNHNTCSNEAVKGSVMAPLVAATFHKFSWSDCSREEFEKNVKKWSCLSNPPAGLGEIVLNATLQNAFSMDEQCRMEFGEGYVLCRAFDIIEPCSHLWCGHEKTPLVCKTKKGSPLEGTPCGFNKWCVSGYCEDIDEKHLGRVPVTLNPQDGGWSDWGPWGFCSRSCGAGVQFRTRKCNNPIPLYGGADCQGQSEEWSICNNNKPCPEPLQDIRAEQCKRLPKLIDLLEKRQANMTWLPYESDEPDKKCKLICISEETKEVFRTGENLIDGTPCSYETLDNICIQGVCQFLGCDGQLFSKVKTDMCGVCGGNNSKCSDVESIVHRRLKREVSRVAVVPRMAAGIRLEANVTMASKEDPAVAFILKNRRKKKYTITIPNTGLRTDIIEGTKFYYEKSQNKHKMWANGPILAEMVLLIYAPISEVEEGLNVSIYSKYIINKGTSTAPTRHKWILGGWGPCSASCGGGRRQKTVACWDTLNQKLVRRKHCSLITKPNPTYEKCNSFDCNFQWIAGNWEPCSATCGSHGIQDRELYCVPQQVLSKMLFKNNGTVMDEPWKYMMNPNKCSGLTPQSRRPCNREACSSFWSFGGWSQCSASCGKGFSFRSSYCPAPANGGSYTCGPTSPGDQKRVCYGETRRSNPLCKGHKKKTCIADKSQYCSLQELTKYCRLGGFRRMCCKSCLGFHLNVTSTSI